MDGIEVAEAVVEIDDLDVFGVEQIGDDRLRMVREEHDREGTSVVRGHVFPAADQLPEDFQSVLRIVMDQSPLLDGGLHGPRCLVRATLFPPRLQIF